MSKLFDPVALRIRTIIDNRDTKKLKHFYMAKETGNQMKIQNTE